MNKIYLYDAQSKNLRTSQATSVSIGSTDKATIRIDAPVPMLGVLMVKQDACNFYPGPEIKSYTLNGEEMKGSATLPADKPALLACASCMLVVAYGGERMNDVMQQCDPKSWLLYNESSSAWEGPIHIVNIASDPRKASPEAYVVMTGLYDCMGRWKDLIAFAMRLYPMKAAAAATPKSELTDEQRRAEIFTSHPDDRDTHETPRTHHVDEEKGKYTCPVCWLHFNAGDVMSIASHPDLMGDEILGRDSMRRFWASRFNSRGQALDEKGVPCPDLACPHCRRKLPPHFLEMDAHIFSIIGAPSSGKSYYLASLVNGMAHNALSDFRMVWRDADPSGNTMLNEVVNRLFSSETAEEASLSKTDLEGALYEELYRHGRMVKLPRPFIFDISKIGSRRTPASLVFYDNAGEHFEPGRNSEDSPGAQHVAVADGLFFLFDPTTSMPFKRLIGHKDDPQLHQKGKLDQQEIIMAETISRISTILNLRAGQQIKTPLAVIIGKCDLWEECLDKALVPIVRDGRLSQAAVDANSDTIRRFMLKLHPALCASAETLSTDVRYFAVSQLGCSPISFPDPINGGTKIGPDPKLLNPRHICDPTYWVLSRITPDIIPVA